MAPFHTRLAILAFNAGVAASHSPTCAANPGCVAVGLIGDDHCCPTDDGMQLACCAASPSACLSNPGCVAVGLNGYDNCCPTDDGMQLACCSAPSPPLPVPDPPAPVPDPPAPAPSPPSPSPVPSIILENAGNRTCLGYERFFMKHAMVLALAVSPCPDPQSDSNSMPTLWTIQSGLLMSTGRGQGRGLCAWPHDSDEGLKFVWLGLCYASHAAKLSWSFDSGSVSFHLGTEKWCLDFSGDRDDARVRANPCDHSLSQRWWPHALAPAWTVV